MNNPSESMQYLQHISAPDVREAYIYLLNFSMTLESYTCHPAPHGYIKRNFHYFKDGISHYAFVINKKWLLFYIQKPVLAESMISISEIENTFPTVKQRKDGEINFKIYNKRQAENLMQILFQRHN